MSIEFLRVRVKVLTIFLLRFFEKLKNKKIKKINKKCIPVGEGVLTKGRKNKEKWDRRMGRSAWELVMRARRSGDVFPSRVLVVVFGAALWV